MPTHCLHLPRRRHSCRGHDVRVAAQHLVLTRHRRAHVHELARGHRPHPHTEVVAGRQQDVRLRETHRTTTHLRVELQPLELLRPLQRRHQLAVRRLPDLDHAVHVASGAVLAARAVRHGAHTVLRVRRSRDAHLVSRQLALLLGVVVVEEEGAVVLTARQHLAVQTGVERHAQHGVRVLLEGLGWRRATERTRKESRCTSIGSSSSPSSSFSSSATRVNATDIPYSPLRPFR